VNASATVPTLWSRLLEFAERRLPALTRLKRPEALPILLDRRRIYVLPTRFGLLYSAVLIVMLLGALNYNNNPALLLASLLGAASYQSVFQAFRTLNRLELHALHATPCHVGESLQLHLHFRADGRSRESLHLRGDDSEAVFELGPQGNRIAIEISAPRRGWRQLGRLRLSSQYPFGLFEVWSWLHPQFAALVYPRLEINAPPLPRAGTQLSAARSVRMSGDELASLREYRPDDPLRNIAWKASARHDRLLVKEFELRRGQEIVLDYGALQGMPHEMRISRLASWICRADSEQQPYALQLPQRRIGPAYGPEHRHACLRELALLPGSAP
jgi:uncharacterized protein (DUF58 family)